MDPCDICISMHCCQEANDCFNDADCLCFIDTCNGDPACAANTCGLTNPDQVPAIAAFFECVSFNCGNTC